MADAFEVNTAEVKHTADVANGISEELGRGKIERSLPESAFGGTRVAHAASEFVGNWSDGREKIRESAERLGKLLGATADAYAEADRKIAAAEAASVTGGSGCR